jgi:Rho GTPase-activating protein RGD1
MKNRLEATSEELERVLLQKEGESFKESAVRSPGGATGKRAIGKAVAKGGMLLKGKNPGNVCMPNLIDVHVIQYPHCSDSAARR